MATKQRGKAAPSSETDDNEKPAQMFSLLLESSDEAPDDEAPDEVTFADSKAQAVRSVKRALDTARREKELLKEKRRKRQELFQEQKKRKLLPADLLEEIDSVSSKKQRQSEDTGREEQREDEDEREGEKKQKKKINKRSGKLVHVRNLRGNYTVATLKEEQASASFQQQAAEDFLRSRLYGPGSGRTTSNELLSVQNKKGRNKGAAVQFVKTDWACKEKAKAEKLKKRWIHKRQIPSC